MLEIIVLSFIQGVTEFIPVSSSSHLIIISSYFNFQNQNLSIFEKLRVLFSLFYRHDVYKKLKKLLSNNNYDGAIVLQFWGKLSPSIFKALKKRNVPVALRISDFSFLRKLYSFFQS